MQGHAELQDMTPSRKKLSRLCGERLARCRLNLFREFLGEKMEMAITNAHELHCDLYQHYDHNCSYMMYKCSICLACAGSGPHYQPHNTWLVVYTITATHTIQFDDLN